MTRHVFAPTEERRRLVCELTGLGLSKAEIARVIVPGGITLATLRRHFREELAIGRSQANAAVARSLFQQACTGNVAACKLWLERNAGGGMPASGNGEEDVQQVLSSLVAGARQRLERKLARLRAHLDDRQVSGPAE